METDTRTAMLRCVDAAAKAVNTLADPEYHYEHEAAESEIATALSELRQLIERTFDDPKAFWASCTPAQVKARLNVAPKVAERWTTRETAYGFETVRMSAGGQDVAFAWCRANGLPRYRIEGGPVQGGGAFGDDLEAAKAAADAALRAAGWILVDEAPADGKEG